MARRVRPFSREAKKELGDIKSYDVPKNVTSNAMYKKLKRGHFQPITPIKDIRKLAQAKSRKSGVPITISKDLKGANYANAICYTDDNWKTRVHLHPLMQYSYKKNVENIIDHELDHAKVHQRIASHHKKK